MVLLLHRRTVRAFPFKRFAALLRKEWLQILRDPITLRFTIALPMMQLFLFGFAINTDPKNLPAGLLSVDHSKYERTLIAAFRNTGYYDIAMLSSEAEAERGLAQGELLFVITIPPNFDRSVDRGDAPSVLIDADASDPIAVANATAALPALSTALNRDLPPIRQVASRPPLFQIIVHTRCDTERLTVPGLICIVLTSSTVFLTAFSITREHERGTMENLLAMPVQPVEVMLAKVLPYMLDRSRTCLAEKDAVFLVGKLVSLLEAERGANGLRDCRLRLGGEFARDPSERQKDIPYLAVSWGRVSCPDSRLRFPAPREWQCRRPEVLLSPLT
jgi:hypothetical protein